MHTMIPSSLTPSKVSIFRVVVSSIACTTSAHIVNIVSPSAVILSVKEREREGRESQLRERESVCDRERRFLPEDDRLGRWPHTSGPAHSC